MKRRTFWILIGIGIFILLLFVFLSNVLSIGERLRNIHAYVEYAFYGLSVLILWFLILNPLRVIMFAPTFSIDVMATEDQSYRVYKSAAKTLLKLEHVSDQDKALLTTHLEDKTGLKLAIRTVFDGSIKNEIEKVIISHSKTVLTTTAISQNGNLDMFAVIFTNIKMIKEIVKLCGFRPSYTNLAKLSVNVAVTAMIAEGLEDVNINEVMPSKIGETLNDIPFVRTATNSVFQGISNGMLTARIGIVTRKYLFQDNKLLTTREIRLQAYKESFKLMPVIVRDGLVGFPKGIISVMSTPFKKNPFKRSTEE